MTRIPRVARASAATLLIHLALSSALAPARLDAQPAVSIRAHVGAGILNARGGLPQAPILSSTGHVVTFASFGPTAALGVGLEVVPSNVPVKLRLGARRSGQNREVGVWGCADVAGEPSSCFDILIEVPTDITTTAATVDVLGVIGAGPVTLHPILGLGWVRYAYDWDPSDVGSFSLAPGAAHFDSVALHYGAAVGIPMGPLQVELEASEYRSSADRGRPDRSFATSLGISAPIG